MSFYKLASLQGRTALVTGGAGHIGKIAAETLAELGASVVITDLITADGLREARRIRELTGQDVQFLPADMGSDEDIRRMVQSFVVNRPTVDILVHAAALVGSSNLQGWAVPFEEQSLETWELALRINLSSAFTLVRELTPHMQMSRKASVVLISSIYGFLGPDPHLYEDTTLNAPAAYFASKGGIEQLARWLASSLAPFIRVNTICPGGVERGQDPRFRERYCNKTPLGRMAVEDDLRGAIGYLCSDLSAYVTGHRLVVDGGLSIR